ncbi:ribonucleotide reductase [Puniceibacterium antarcticum]|uniref:Vitamin B12-dependent ribonucleotide reductase n=1 Tax=Puniceibacterium antarcticum TaxID=1206336 RepID=A0A2G8RK18_9RHOB|nr:adenosylcobalamin-dependent ribonucleoside-diphosphate reductase [Puniceibacterium antarcticum]PIL21900.1 ribonucleotide reductase [Puniceibacterium antarcticum]
MYDFEMPLEPEQKFCQPIARQIWSTKYQYRSDPKNSDKTIEDTWNRVAHGLASYESSRDKVRVAEEFYHAMKDFKLLPAGRILAGCGTEYNVSLSNTFVMRTIPDSVPGIMDTIKDAALTMQMGGGIGFDFSTIRPSGTLVRGLNCPAAGPLAVMDICDVVCKMLVSGFGRGAMMATMRCDHPDIEAFITAKSDRQRMRNFNMSVMISDAFMVALSTDAHWDLIWDGKVVRRTRATDIWDRIMHQTHASAEPGVLFIDRINAQNPLNYAETICTTNSCAEQPLPPNGTCPLASINLARLIAFPFTADACFDLTELRRLVEVGVRLLDNALSVSKYALDAQREMAERQRRIGIGITGVADAIAMMGERYGSAAAVSLIESWMRKIQNAAYAASARLAKERGAFPDFDAERHMENLMIQSLDPDVRALIAAHGLRNGTLTTIAPAGTISLLAGNVSSGIEPIFSTSFRRKINHPDGTTSTEEVADYAAMIFSQTFGNETPHPAYFVTAPELAPQYHIRMQAAAQKWIDSGISKTINCKEDIAFETFKEIYLMAYETGCKGCTTYRPNVITGSILT